MDNTDLLAIDGALSSDVIKRLIDLHLLTKSRPRGKTVTVVGDLEHVKGLLAYLKENGLRVRFYPWRRRYPPGLVAHTDQVLTLGASERLDQLLVQFSQSKTIRFLSEEELPHVTTSPHPVPQS